MSLGLEIINKYYFLLFATHPLYYAGDRSTPEECGVWATAGRVVSARRSIVGRLMWRWEEEETFSAATTTMMGWDNFATAENK